MAMFDDILNKVGEAYEPSTGKGFPYGSYEATIQMAEKVEKDLAKKDGAEIIELHVTKLDDEEVQGESRLYFHTSGAVKMSVAKVLGLLVHNVPEEKKDAVRSLGHKLFDGLEDTPETWTKSRNLCFDLISEKLIDKKCWVMAEPRGNYDTTKFVDIWHYEQKVDAAKLLGGEEITSDNINDVDFGDI